MQDYQAINQQQQIGSNEEAPIQALIDRKILESYLQSIGSQQYVSEELNYIKSLVEATELPVYAKERLYGLFDKTTVLSKYTDMDIAVILAMANQTVALILYFMPPEQITDNLILDLKQILMLHFKMVLRARGGFEREQQNTRHQVSTITGGSRGEEPKKKSITQKILGFGG